MNKLILTAHVKKRYVQRFKPKLKIALRCMNDRLYCKDCKTIMTELEQEIHDIFSVCKATKSYLNNTSGMVYLYDTYGFDEKFYFFHNHHILFVAIQHALNEYVAITCYNLKHKKHVFGDLTHKKF